MGVVLKGGRIVTSEKTYLADLRIEGEKISAIGENLVQEGDRVIDVEGSLVLPGGIDVHTHFGADAGGIVADSFETGTRAALMGGTTTIVDFAEQVQGGSLREALDSWHEMSVDQCFTDYGFHMTLADWNEKTAEEMEEIVEEGISSFKVFFAYEGLQMPDNHIYGLLKRAKDLGALCSFHCESGDLIEELRREAVKEGRLEPKYHRQTRPASLERESIDRLLTIAELVDTPVYVVHLSSKEGYEELMEARKKGQDFLIETCPHYLLLDESYYEPKGEDPFEGAKYVLSPPLRDLASQTALWQGLAEDQIDVIATDHCAFHYKGQKDLGRDDFSQIPNGGPGVEDRYKLIYTYGVDGGKISLEKMVEVLSEKPAKIFGLYPEKGVLQEGSDADILVFNPNNDSVIRAENQTQNVDYNLYEGFKVKGHFDYIFLRGQLLIEDEQLKESRPQGRYLKREKTLDGLLSL